MTITNHTIRGFTLLETLASIAIISLVIVGPLSVLSNSSSYARQTKDVIIATYLAEESIELLQNQYDSLYIFCKKSPGATDAGGLCLPTGTEATTGQTSWRLLKQRLGSPSTLPSCFGDESASHGCSFDTLDMTGDVTAVPPPRYAADSAECPFLVKVNRTIHGEVANHGNGGNVQPVAVNTTKSSYVCSGVVAHQALSTVDNTKPFTRSIVIDQLPTFESGSRYEQYSDDLRITSEVKFRGINGRTQTLRVIRFMSPRL